MIVTMDTLEEAVLETSIEGITTTRGALVTEIGGNNDAKPYNALLASEIPILGTAHPTIPGIVVVRHRVQMIDGDKARIAIQYAFPGEFSAVGLGAPPRITIRGTSQPATTMIDVYGKEIVIPSWKRERPLAEGETGPPAEETIQAQNVSVDYQQTMIVVTFSRLEVQFPLNAIRYYTNTVNSRGVFGDGPHRWLCTEPIADTMDGGVTWDVTYTFQSNYSHSGWDADVAATEPGNSGQFATGAKIGTGILTGVRIYNETDFYNLGLTL